MTIKEKIDATVGAEAGAVSAVHLWKEGVFWLAYEQSAYAVWLQKGYKPTKKYVKAASMEVVSIGFPNVETLQATSLQATPHQITDGHIVIQLPAAIDHAAFLAWKNGIAMPAAAGQGSAPLSCGDGTGERSVLERIKNFDLSNATPIECMALLEGKKKLTVDNFFNSFLFFQ
ncbi:hypothetical protein FACS189430_05490 [Bacteroidia bacterium]|nr:hypothetical protein FACS189430_05490 [Bacteroidia bacterium]